MRLFFVRVRIFVDSYFSGWKGILKVNSETFPPFHTLVLSAEPTENGVELTASEGDTEFVLVRLHLS